MPGTQTPRSRCLTLPAWGAAGGPGSWLQGWLGGGLAGIGGIQSKKETMQSLNDLLVSYLERERRLEADNWRLETKIREYLEKKGPQANKKFRVH